MVLLNIGDLQGKCVKSYMAHFSDMTKETDTGKEFIPTVFPKHVITGNTLTFLSLTAIPSLSSHIGADLRDSVTFEGRH